MFFIFILDVMCVEVLFLYFVVEYSIFFLVVDCFIRFCKVMFFDSKIVFKFFCSCIKKI